MIDRPILFNGAMVRAILEGRKTVTRRPVKDTGLYAIDADIHGQSTAARELLSLATRCPYGQPGDRLWVRETFADAGCRLTYRADQNDGAHCVVKRWTPSIHMPRWASRILLEVTATRVERLQEITEEQARAEGVMRDEERPEEHDWRNNGKLCPECAGTGLHSGIGSGGGVIFDIDCRECDTAIKRFKHLWASTGGDWDASPWVWVVDFKRIDQ